MAEDHGVLRQTFGARRSHVIVAQRLEHHRAGQPGQERRLEEAKCDGR